MKRAKARTTSEVTGTQRKSVGASELSRRDRRSQFGGDHSFSGGCCLDHAAAGGPTALPATLWRARLRMDDGLGAGTLFTLSACSGWGAFLTSYCAAPKGTANNVRRCPLGGDRLDWGGPHEESGTCLQPVVMGMKRLKTCSTLAGAATGEWRLQPATPSLLVSLSHEGGPSLGLWRRRGTGGSEFDSGAGCFQFFGQFFGGVTQGIG